MKNHVGPLAVDDDEEVEFALERDRDRVRLTFFENIKCTDEDPKTSSVILHNYLFGYLLSKALPFIILLDFRRA